MKLNRKLQTFRNVTSKITKRDNQINANRSEFKNPQRGRRTSEIELEREPARARLANLSQFFMIESFVSVKLMKCIEIEREIQWGQVIKILPDLLKYKNKIKLNRKG